jgi:predicted lipoprotein
VTGHRRQARRIGSLLLFLFGVAAGESFAGDTQLNLRVVDKHIIPAYQRLEKATASLHDDAVNFCEQPSTRTLADVQGGFRDAMGAWQEIQHIRFGPVEYLLRAHRLQLWPDKRGSVGKHLRRMLEAGDRGVLEPDRFAAISVAVQGFSALERILFDTNAESAAFFAPEAREYRFLFLQTITGNLVRVTSGIVTDWTRSQEPYRTFVATASEGNAVFESEREVSSQLLNSLHTQWQLIVDRKLDRPLGDSPRNARPKRAESWRSRNSLANIRANLLGTRELYRVGFAPRLADPELRLEIEAGFNETLKAVDAIHEPLYRAVSSPDERSRVEALRLQASRLENLLGERLPEALDLPLGFNSLDGD